MQKSDLRVLPLVLLVILLATTAASLPQQDSIVAPGMINETIYSGYLSTRVDTRKIHYVFVAARNQANKAPLTVWFNGGPGCSSLIGFLQEVGPYLVGNKYQQGDLLTRNPYSWNQVSNLLFLESPAIVGFSTDKDNTYHWTDNEAANDAFAALKDFLFNKAPQFFMRQVYLSGQSYAGKYVPDVAVRILSNNMGPVSQYINFKGIILGNGVMNFRDYSLDRSQIQYMYEHDFIDDRLWSIYRDACRKDFNSPRCKYFQYQLEMDEDQVNPYNVYQLCKQVKSTQVVRLLEAIRQFKKLSNPKEKKQPIVSSETPSIPSGSPSSEQTPVFPHLGEPERSPLNLLLSLTQIPECPNDNGAISYLNLNKFHFKVDKVNKTWSPCTELRYTISQDGSMEEYRRIFLNPAIKVWLFSGDWDDVVPYRDTEKNLEVLKIAKVGEWDPWFWGQHHAGFYQLYEKLTLITVKGASHMVPQTKPRQAYQMFYNFIKNRPINTPVPTSQYNQQIVQQEIKQSR